MGNFLHPDQGGAADRDCHAEARAIQACMVDSVREHKDLSRCSVAVKDLYECCAAMWLTHARTGKAPGDVKDDVCPLPPGILGVGRKV